MPRQIIMWPLDRRWYTVRCLRAVGGILACFCKGLKTMSQADTFQVLSREVLAEVTRSLALVEDEKAEQVAEKLLGARKVFAI